MATHYSTLAWKTSWTKEPGRPKSMGSQRVRPDWATSLSFFTFTDIELTTSPFSSVVVVQLLSCLTLWDPMDCSMPAFPDYLLEFAQIHVCWVSDAVYPSHPLLSSSPFVFSLSQHQGLFQWVSIFTSGSQSIGALAKASILPVNIQGWSPLRLTGLKWVDYPFSGG